jgi:hypothetical protein
LDVSGWIMPNTGQKEPAPTISPSTGCWLYDSVVMNLNWVNIWFHLGNPICKK